MTMLQEPGPHEVSVADRLVAHAKVGIGHVGRNLLVARRHQLDAVAHRVERIEHADVAVPQIPNT
jgi:hypothetical protein